MATVLTYGTFDHFHEGHLRLLKRAKALGDFLIVGITSESFDQRRGKINVEQSLTERIKGVEDAKIADKIIIEEFEGQKIDDIKRYHADIFVVGDDWKGKFDYLKDYCQVIYLPRTEGISSSKLRSKESPIQLGFIGNRHLCQKFIQESRFVNGCNVLGYYHENEREAISGVKSYQQYETLLSNSDAVYIASSPKFHYKQIKEALSKGKHVMVESPITLKIEEYRELLKLAKEKGLVLMDAIKTAYSIAYYRLLLLIKTEIIGSVISIDATATSLKNLEATTKEENAWPNFCFWAPTVLLPVFQIFGTDGFDYSFITKWFDKGKEIDSFSKINLDFTSTTATCKCGNGIKSEGELIISGTKGYIYVPSPWWKTDYFELRFENQSENKKFFYPLEGEGIRYLILSFYRSIKEKNNYSYISEDVTEAIISMMQAYYQKKNLRSLQ